MGTSSDGHGAAVTINSTLYEYSVSTRSKSTVSKVEHVIPASEDCMGDVTGLTVHGDELFILRKWCKGLIEVYNATNFKFKRNIEVINLEGVCYCGLTSCDSNHCLYVSYWYDGGGSVGHIARVELTGDNEVVKWGLKRNYEPQGLSVNNEHNLIVVAGSGQQPRHKLIEYTTRGGLVREILLHDDVVWPQHAVQLNSRQFVVSHGDDGVGALQRVCVVDANNGRVLLSYGNKRGSETGMLNDPRNLALDKNGFLFVADCDNNRIVVLDRTLKWSRDLQLDGNVERPWSLHLDEQRNLLFVGERDGDESRVVIVTLR